MRVVLASGSPRRHQLLRSIGLDFEVVAPDVDESLHPGESPRAHVQRLAAAKAADVAARLDAGEPVAVIAADTTVDVDGRVLAKPVDDDEARRMLRLLSGRTHEVHTAVHGRVRDATHTATVTTLVTFARLSDRGIEWYLAMGEHHDKAGAYAMQSAGAALVHRIEGSPSNVIGLPLVETIGVLRACGVSVVGSTGMEPV